MSTPLPLSIHSGCRTGGHCQGIAVDTKRERIFYSFTTELVVTDLAGNLLGSVTGLTGHLGCIDFNDEDGRLYGSLEYKNDAIGQGILKRLGVRRDVEDGFYIVSFDVDRIDRPDMDASASGVMKAVYLKTVADDFSATVLNGGRSFRHRLGCSGIDGTTFGPMPGEPEGRQYLFVAYGVYSENERTDNDYQVILCYDVAGWRDLEKPLLQTAMHRSGPAEPLRTFFVRTGNTNYGVQNLEYDAHTRRFFMTVYRGKKSGWPNYTLFAVDAAIPPRTRRLIGVEPDTEGEVLTLAEAGLKDEATGVRGWYLPAGETAATGLYAFGDGRYYLSLDGKNARGWFTNATLYTWRDEDAFIRVR